MPLPTMVQSMQQIIILYPHPQMMRMWRDPHLAAMVFACGFFGIYAQLAFIAGLALTNADLAALLQPAAPVLTVALSVAVGAERTSSAVPKAPRPSTRSVLYFAATRAATREGIRRRQRRRRTRRRRRRRRPSRRSVSSCRLRRRRSTESFYVFGPKTKKRQCTFASPS